MKLSEIVEATGLSKSYASQVRAGKFTPHMSTWAALTRLVEIDPQAVGDGREQIGTPKAGPPR